MSRHDSGDKNASGNAQSIRWEGLPREPDPSRSDMRTRSGSDVARIFAITCARCFFTVFSDVPNSAAVCLFCAARDDKRHHRTLALGQFVKPAAKVVNRMTLLTGEPVMFDRALHAIDERLGVEGLRQDVMRSGLEDAYRHRHVCVSRHEDQRSIEPVFAAHLLSIESAQRERSNVDDDAMDVVMAHALSRIGRRREGLALEAH